MTVIAGRYELGASLGAGGMADVVRGRDLLLGRDVAVKLFRPGVEVERVRQEVRLHARLSHHGLVTAFDSGTDETGRTFLVLQLVDGPTLAEQVRRGPLTPAQATRLGTDVADALAHVHATGIVHRDVKPANILISADGSARVTDFGIAQELGQAGLTVTGFTLGTVPYLSPEQVRGQAATSASDVYALGLVLLEALTGRREYPGMNAEGALARLTRPPLVPARLPAPWPQLLADMTADDPAARPSALRVAAVLRGAPPVSEPTETVAVPVPVPVPASASAPVLPAPRLPLVRPARPAAAPARARRVRVPALAATALLLGGGGLALTAVGGTQQAPLPGPVAPTTQPVSATVAPAVPAAARVAPAPVRTTAPRPTTAGTAVRTTAPARPVPVLTTHAPARPKASRPPAADKPKPVRKPHTRGRA